MIPFYLQSLFHFPQAVIVTHFSHFLKDILSIYVLFILSYTNGGMLYGFLYLHFSRNT